MEDAEDFYSAHVWLRGVEHTQWGILLLLIGTSLAFLGFISVVMFVQFIIILIGAILVILGRKSFGLVHSRNVIISIVLFIFGFLGGIVIGVALVDSIRSAVINRDVDAFASNFRPILIGAIVIGSISGLSSVLFTYALQKRIGRILLWTAYGTSLILITYSLMVMRDLVMAVLTLETPALLDVEAEIESGRARGYLLSLIPSLLFAAADYLAYSRISAGEIPQPEILPEALEALSPGPVKAESRAIVSDYCPNCGAALISRASPCPTCGATP